MIAIERRLFMPKINVYHVIRGLKERWQNVLNVNKVNSCLRKAYAKDVISKKEPKQ
jgi:hypothetical protein